jgi:putative spermidine/putrescine transport system substrate-binding protein
MADYMDEGVARDLASIALEKLAAGTVDRRSVLKALGALGFVGTAEGLLAGTASAASGKLVLANFGGPEIPAFQKAFCEPFTKATGMEVVIDGSGPRNALIKAAVEAHAVAWDVCDTATIATIINGRGGVLQPMDYKIVDKAKVMPGFALEHGVANYTYSYVLAFDKKRFPQPPRNWADFWDRKKFPGMRTMAKTPTGQLEAAALAAGVPRDKIYPLDLEVAIKKIKEIKNDVIFWENGQQCMQMFRDREVVMGNIWHHRAAPLLAELKGDAFGWIWTDGNLNASAWNIPKGNPAGTEAAMKFVASTQDPAQQVVLFQMVGSGPSNPAAHAMIPAEMRYGDPGQPDNFKAQILNDGQWWADNQAKATDMWLDAISG